MLRILTLFGTRPEIVALAPVLRAQEAGAERLGLRRVADATRQVLSGCDPRDAVEAPADRERKSIVLTTHRRAEDDSRARRIAAVPVPFSDGRRGSRIVHAIDRWLGADAVVA